MLADLVEEHGDRCGFEGEVMNRTFASAGLMTSNSGVVLYLPTGEVFQVTVVQAK
jgi:hypothetical protein